MKPQQCLPKCSAGRVQNIEEDVVFQEEGIVKIF